MFVYITLPWMLQKHDCQLVCIGNDRINVIQCQEQSIISDYTNPPKVAYMGTSTAKERAARGLARNERRRTGNLDSMRSLSTL